MQPAWTLLANAEIRDDIIAAGADMLRAGASAADVAERIARDVEDDPNEHTVGYGGKPNIMGEVELDASFMDGDTLKAGAVAALKGFAHPISVAREVMKRLPHVLLAGAGAARFAEEIGAERRDNLSPEARQMWFDQLERMGLREQIFQGSNSMPDAKTLFQARVKDVIGAVNQALTVKEGHDTMNVIVRDAKGSVCSAVTTSGIAWKYPGRVGDSPVIGAGNYADSRHGAAACMGLGEITIRLAIAARAVSLMRAGFSLQEAGIDVLNDMQPVIGQSIAEHHMARADWVRVLIMDRHGNVGGFATRAGLHYKVHTSEDAQPQLREAETL
jgi:beta-aspartyl-peptidase (threonine type)